MKQIGWIVVMLQGVPEVPKVDLISCRWCELDKIELGKWSFTSQSQVFTEKNYSFQDNSIISSPNFQVDFWMPEIPVVKDSLGGRAPTSRTLALPLVEFVAGTIRSIPPMWHPSRTPRTRWVREKKLRKIGILNQRMKLEKNGVESRYDWLSQWG